MPSMMLTTARVPWLCSLQQWLARSFLCLTFVEGLVHIHRTDASVMQLGLHLASTFLDGASSHVIAAALPNNPGNQA